MNYWEPAFKHITEKVPETCWQKLVHPDETMDLDVEIAIFQEHRMAFFYWLKWTQKLRKYRGHNYEPPILVSLDWHQDLALPHNLSDLSALKQNNLAEAAIFTWYRLNPTNDEQILSAAYLNLIGDVHVVMKDQPSHVNIYKDCCGNTHNLKSYETVDDMLDELKTTEYHLTYLDIDLDYFVASRRSPRDRDILSLMSDETIKSIIRPDSDLMQWLFPRFAGLTIATEPTYCGGLQNSHSLLNIINTTLFDSKLLRYKDRLCSWSHLEDIYAE